MSLNFTSKELKKQARALANAQRPTKPQPARKKTEEKKESLPKKRAPSQPVSAIAESLEVKEPPQKQPRKRDGSFVNKNLVMSADLEGPNEGKVQESSQSIQGHQASSQASVSQRKPGKSAKKDATAKIDTSGDKSKVGGVHVQQRLFDRLNQSIVEPDTQLRADLIRYMQSGVSVATTDELWRTKNRWVETSLKASFVETLHKAIDADPEAQKKLQQFDGADCIHLTLKYMCENEGKLDKEEKAYFFYLKGEFTPERIPYIGDIERIAKDLVTIDQQKAADLVYRLYIFLRDVTFNAKVPWRVGYLAAQLGCIAEILMICYRKNGNVMDVGNSSHWTYDQPSDKATGSHESDLLWAAHQVYPQLSAKCLRFMSINAGMFFSEAVFKRINAGARELSQALVMFINAFCAGNRSIESDLDMIIKVFTSNAWMQRYLLSIQPKEGETRLTITQFTELLLNMSLLPEHQLGELISSCGNDLQTVFTGLPLAVKNKKNEDIEEQKVTEKLQALIKHESSAVKDKIKELESISKNLDEKNLGYNEQLNQIFISGWAAANTSKITIACVPAGSGKSFCILLLAAYYQSIGKKVAIVTSSAFLRDQLSMKIAKYLDEMTLQICMNGLKTKWKDNFVVLVDEIDEVAKLTAIKTTPHNTKPIMLRGFYEFFKADKIHGFTATNTVELNDFWKLTPDCISLQINRSFLSEAQLSGDVLATCQIFKKTADTKEQLLEQIQNDIAKIVKQKCCPVIVFANTGFDTLAGLLRDKYSGPSVGFFLIKDSQTALNYEKTLQNRTHGVIMITAEFCRGYDIKLGKDSEVLIYDSGNEFSYSTVVQMAGRGSRRMGEQAAFYYNSEIDITTDVVEYLKEREAQYKDLALLTKAFWGAFEKGDDDIKKVLALFAQGFRGDFSRKKVRDEHSNAYFIMFPGEKQEEVDYAGHEDDY